MNYCAHHVKEADNSGFGKEKKVVEADDLPAPSPINDAAGEFFRCFAFITRQYCVETCRSTFSKHLEDNVLKIFRYRINTELQEPCNYASIGIKQNLAAESPATDRGDGALNKKPTTA